MHCDIRFCAFWKNQKCLLDRILLDETGACTDCIILLSDNETFHRNDLLHDEDQSPFLRNTLAKAPVISDNPNKNIDPSKEEYRALYDQARQKFLNQLRRLLPAEDQDLILRFEIKVNELSNAELNALCYESIYHTKDLIEALHL